MTANPQHHQSHAQQQRRRWGAFDTTGVHLFNDRHPIYQGIAAVARVRKAEPALRYGRQYFRDISGDGALRHPD